MGPSMRHQLSAFGLTVDRDAPPSVYRGRNGLPAMEVHSVRVARRRGFRDTLVTDLVVEVRQRRRGYFDPAMQRAVDEGKVKPEKGGQDFRFRRGCTLIIDPVRRQVRYAIRTRGDVCDDRELERVRAYLAARNAGVESPFYGGYSSGIHLDDEHFAALHRRTTAAPDF